MQPVYKFKHSGDLGDIIFSLPTIRALGGGVLYLDPLGAETAKSVKDFKTKLSLKSALGMKDFLNTQEYITDVKIWAGEEIDYNLDSFRDNIKYNNLVISHLSAFNLDKDISKNQWIDVQEKIQLPKQFIISRSVRYHSNYPFWVELLKKIKNDSVFIGLEKEHEIFEYTFEVSIPYYPTPTIKDLAIAINSCEQIFCNQSLPHAIAEGLHHSLVCEIFRVYPAAVFENKVSSIYV